MTEKYNLSSRQLHARIQAQEYERLSKDTKQSLQNPTKQAERQSTAHAVVEYIKDPILIRSKDKIDDEISEQILQQLIMEDLPHFLKELGAGFTFVDNEYKIKVDKEYNYIDLLLFNIIHNCYVIVELKITELKAEHIGQIQKYMKVVDNILTSPSQQPAVGVVITRKNNHFIKGYCSDERIFGVEWRLVG